MTLSRNDATRLAWKWIAQQGNLPDVAFPMGRKKVLSGAHIIDVLVRATCRQRGTTAFLVCRLKIAASDDLVVLKDRREYISRLLNERIPSSQHVPTVYSDNEHVERFFAAVAAIKLPDWIRSVERADECTNDAHAFALARVRKGDVRIPILIFKSKQHKGTYFSSRCARTTGQTIGMVVQPTSSDAAIQYKLLQQITARLSNAVIR